MDVRLSRGRSTILGGILFAASWLHAAPACAADPLLMFLLGWAKNIIESQIEANAQKQQQLAPVAPVVAAPALPRAPAKVTEGDLRAVVDDGFAYLSPAQRAELLASVEKALSDPANSAYREDILSQFAQVARQAGYAYRQLERLSTDQKRMVAHQFAGNFRSLDPVQQQELLQRLKQNALPLPSDLNQMMLAALASG